jgi:anti-sigma B factor antagonist
VCSNDRILRVFRITGLDKVFGIHDSLEEALAA